MYKVLGLNEDGSSALPSANEPGSYGSLIYQFADFGTGPKTQRSRTTRLIGSIGEAILLKPG